MAGMRFESGVCEEGPTRQAIYDIYLWTRLRDRNLKEVKVGFVTYFSSMWKYLSTGTPRAPAFRNFHLVAPIDADESKDLRRKGQNIAMNMYLCM